MDSCILLKRNDPGGKQLFTKMIAPSLIPHASSGSINFIVTDTPAIGGIIGSAPIWNPGFCIVPGSLFAFFLVYRKLRI